MGILQFSQAQKQLKGQLWLGNESAISQMLGMGKEILDHEELIDFDTYLSDIEKVTSQELQEVANKYFDESQLQILTYQPNEEAESE
jgi:predicted Zn-dependent peptidase